MAIFILDCDAVTASVGSLDSVYSQVVQIADSVRAYDISCEDGFDFSTAKSSIVANIEACSVKIKNTIDLINYVVDSHTNLQNSIEFDSTYSNQIESNETDLSVSEKSSDKVSTTNVNNNFLNGNSSTNISANAVKSADSSVNSSFNNSTSSVNVVSSVIANEMIASSELENDNEILNEKKDNGNNRLINESNDHKQNKNIKDNKNSNSIKNKDNDTDTDTESDKKSGKVSKNIKKKIFSSKSFRYNASGYGLLENRYVISCDESFGSVGDGLTIKCSDGTEVKCIIGSVNNSKNSINFYINGDICKEGTYDEILTSTLDKVKNTGPIDFLSDLDTEII